LEFEERWWLVAFVCEVEGEQHRVAGAEERVVWWGADDADLDVLVVQQWFELASGEVCEDSDRPLRGGVLGERLCEVRGERDAAFVYEEIDLAGCVREERAWVGRGVVGLVGPCSCDLGASVAVGRIGAGGWRGYVVGTELVFGEVECAGDGGAMAGLGRGGSGEPSLDGFRVDADDVGELLGSQSGLLEGVLEARVRHFCPLTRRRPG
jgi:hypothetical protein